MKYLMTVMLTLVFSEAGAALSSDEQSKLLQQWQGDVKARAEAASAKCNLSISATMGSDFVAPFVAANAKASLYCAAPLEALLGMCADEMAKNEIKKKVKKLTCKAGQADQMSLSLSAGEIIFTVGPKASNLSDRAKNFFENNL